MKWMRLSPLSPTLLACISSVHAAALGNDAAEKLNHNAVNLQHRDSTIADGSNATGSAASSDLPVSPAFYPSPWVEGLGDWGEAVAKAKEFVKQLTLMEKVNLTTGVGWEGEACVGNTGSVPRLGFRGFCLQDGPLGIRLSDYNSVFPAGITVAASWDPEIWYARGNAMGSEMRGKGIDVQLGPAIGPLGRIPTGGRNWEGFSPDPVLTGKAVSGTVKGIQDAGVVACTKHYILNEQERFRQAPEAQRYGFNITESSSSNIDDVTMHELYLWPFADAVRAGTGAIMCSYNQVNNSYACQNSYLMNHLLKSELGYQGFVMSDWAAQHAGVSSSLAGLDMTMPGDVTFDSNTSFWGANLTLAVVNGTIPEYRLDDMVTRIMSAFFYVGGDKYHDEPVNFNTWNRDTFGFRHPLQEMGYEQINFHVDVRDDHGKLIRDIAAKSTVLLKNTNAALPLTGKEKFVGVFGEDAGPNPWGANGCDDRGCDNGTLAIGWGSGTSNFPYLITPKTALENEVTGNGGVFDAVLDNWAALQIATLAGQASTAIVFVNADAGEGYISVDGNEGDRKNLTLWKNGDELIANVSALCNNTMVVIHSVGAVLVDQWYDNPNITAILWAGLPGQESGNSIADVLYGRVNPGGKLPFTMGRSLSDYGIDIFSEMNNGNGAPQDYFSEGIFTDYRHFDKMNITPIYEFGFGLSYTTFEVADLTITPSDNPAPYVPNTGMTSPAPQPSGNISTDLADYQFPAGFPRVEPFYIYPFLTSTDAEEASGDPHYGLPAEAYLPPNATSGAPQPVSPAGGAPGGNPGLYEVLATVAATVRNTGRVEGDEVLQVYVSLGGPRDAVRVLRGFQRVRVGPGEEKRVEVELTRRDVASWDEEAGDWVVREWEKRVWVGTSSRKLPLSAPLVLDKW